ncbi:MAG: hypothetical protein AAF322_07500 [Pseudomonadota bacterium]
MKIELRPITEPFQRFMSQTRIIFGVWARFVGGVLLVSLIFGPYAPLAAAAFLLTLFLPVLLLTLWGRSLDAELRWSETEEGPR